MDTTQWPQELGLVKPIEEMMVGGGGATSAAAGATRAPPQLVERRARPQKEKALNCPRCNSTNTKFCYYNNYSLTQPRYFCKTCRRYWTDGGSLRNVPVGGGSRKNKRSSSSASSASFSTTTTTNNNTTSTTTTTTNSNKKFMTHDIPLSSPSHNIKFNQSQDLNLAFPYHSMPHDYTEFPNSSSCMRNTTTTNNNNTTTNNNNNTSGNSRSNPYTASTVGAFSAMELLRSGISSSRGVGSFVPMPLQEYPSVLGFLQDFRPPTALGFPLDHGVGGGAEDHGGEVATTVGGTGNYESSLQESRLLFPFEDLKPAVPNSNTGELEHNRMQSGDPPGFWNGMIHGGGSW